VHGDVGPVLFSVLNPKSVNQLSCSELLCVRSERTHVHSCRGASESNHNLVCSDEDPVRIKIAQRRRQAAGVVSRSSLAGYPLVHPCDFGITFVRILGPVGNGLPTGGEECSVIGGFDLRDGTVRWDAEDNPDEEEQPGDHAGGCN
jgi:hypothetical protein